ncbi:hypothetical protein GQ53DRAFT_722356 [Thozetella sp. PMI_491]|nr:hypothetical protein GQ53DRAFT_722356 [Thozetella sp. PMI_491]
MCFFEQIRWSCGFWKWGRFREQCTTEDRIGETCGLKLVFETNHSDDCCTLCKLIAKKTRRVTKMTQDIQRWKQDGNRPATVEKTQNDVAEILTSISRMVEQHTQNATATTDIRSISVATTETRPRRAIRGQCRPSRRIRILSGRPSSIQEGPQSKLQPLQSNPSSS